MIIKKEFEYIGFVEEYKIPVSGLYLLEAWGAQGGNVTSAYWDEFYLGGYGAYATGSIYLDKDTVIYVGVGQSGSVSEGVYPFNGGGAAKQEKEKCSTETSSGGGSTHFSASNSILKGLSDNKDSVLLVAAGGGGAYTRYCGEGDDGTLLGGHAGGYVGSKPVYVHQDGYSVTVPTGGTQTRGGISNTLWYANDTTDSTPEFNGYFGQGGISDSRAYSGGGGGWYGGASGQWRAGAGGSSHLSWQIHGYRNYKKRMVCYNCAESENSIEYTISTSHYSYLPVRDRAKAGNGFARIALLNPRVSCIIKRCSSSYSFILISLALSC